MTQQSGPHASHDTTSGTVPSRGGSALYLPRRHFQFLVFASRRINLDLGIGGFFSVQVIKLKQ